MTLNAAGFGLQDYLLLVGMEGRTGELLLESGNNIGSVLFHAGRILHAFSPYSRAIGDLLVEQGALSDAELLDILRQQRNGPPAPIGALLIKSGKATFADIEKMVQDQIRSSLRDLLSWKSADYVFIQKTVQPVDGIHLTVHEFISPETLSAVKLFLRVGCETITE